MDVARILVFEDPSASAPGLTHEAFLGPAKPSRPQNLEPGCPKCPQTLANDPKRCTA